MEKMIAAKLLRAGCMAVLSVILLQLAHAAPEGAPPRQVRLLPVGDSPPFRQEIRDGVAYEIDPPRDSLPPLEVMTRPFAQERPAAGERKSAPAAEVMLRLGRISGPMVIPPGAGPLEILRFEGGSPGDPWVRLNRPETGDLLVVLWRGVGQEDWKSPGALVLPDSPADFPAGTVRLINLFPQPVRIAWGGEALTLATREVLLKTVEVKPGADATTLQVLVPDASGNPRRYYSGAVTQQARERGLIVIYRADGSSPRRPLKVINLREPAPVLGPVEGEER
jgi:hypothetical protein